MYLGGTRVYNPTCILHIPTFFLKLLPYCTVLYRYMYYFQFQAIFDSENLPFIQRCYAWLNTMYGTTKPPNHLALTSTNQMRKYLIILFPDIILINILTSRPIVFPIPCCVYPLHQYVQSCTVQYLIFFSKGRVGKTLGILNYLSKLLGTW